MLLSAFAEFVFKVGAAGESKSNTVCLKCELTGSATFFIGVTSPGVFSSAIILELLC